MMKAIEIIVRGVCVRNGKLLVCHGKGQRNTYLPGGHIDCGETAEHALEREIKEEMGLSSRAGRFLGAVEHTYRRKGDSIFEINLVFQLAIPSISSTKQPPCREDHIEFLWVPFKTAGKHQLEPVVLCKVLPHWLSGVSGSPHWASTLK